MSDVIDNRVVEMEFDNRQFESGVSQSLDSIQKLKDSLDFSKTAGSFSVINDALSKIDFHPIQDSIKTVISAVNPMVVVMETSLARITNAAITAGHRITRALTIEPVFTGFQEYTTQIDAIQTILANTEKYGTTLNDVNKALDELNLYADKTIYNFTQMTSNIGRFTAAGVELDSAVKSIEGMSNLAASSGATSEQASRAYYQMSQALAGMGLRLMDYNSLVNAGMGGQLFQEALKQTSRDVASLTKEYTKLSASGMSNADIAKKFGVSIESVDKIISKKYAADVDAIVKKSGSFRDSLNKGWADAYILERTFSKFSTEGMIEYLHEFTGVSKLALEELMELGEKAGFDSKEFRDMADALEDVTDAQREEIKMNLKQARTAEDAATKVKTFKQLKDTIKEAVQSGWTQTWEYIIGDFEQAKAFFTRISDYLGDIIGRYSDFRNKIVGDWSKGGGRDAVIEGLWNIVHIIESFIKPLKGAWENVFPNTNVAAVLINISKAFEELTKRLVPNEETIKRVQMVYEKVFSVFEALRNIIGDLIYSFPKLESAINNSIFSSLLRLFEDKGIADSRSRFIDDLQDLYHTLDDISDKDIKLPGTDGATTKLSKLDSYSKLMTAISDSWSQIYRSSDLSKFQVGSSDFDKLNDSILSMVYGFENGSKIFKEFKDLSQSDFLKHLTEEYSLELNEAEDVYKLVKKLATIEDRILTYSETITSDVSSMLRERTNIRELLTTFVQKTLGTNYERALKIVTNTGYEIKQILDRLKFIFSTTIAIAGTIDMLLSRTLITILTNINDKFIKPFWLYIVGMWLPLLKDIYDASKEYILPILNNVLTGILDIIGQQLQKIDRNFPKWADKVATVIGAILTVSAIIARYLGDKLITAMEEMSRMSLHSMIENVVNSITGAILKLDEAFKGWAGFSLIDAFKGFIDGAKWVLGKINAALGITDKLKWFIDGLKTVMKLWYGLATNDFPNSISDYLYSIQIAFGATEFVNRMRAIIDRVGLILRGAAIFLSEVFSQFRILVDNPGNEDLGTRLTRFFNRIYDAFIEALRLNGVSESVISVLNFVFSVIKQVIDNFAKIVPKLGMFTAKAQPFFAVLVDTVKNYIANSGLDVKSVATAITAILIAVIGIIAISELLIDHGDGIQDALQKMALKWNPIKIYWEKGFETMDAIGDAFGALKNLFKVATIVTVAAAIAVFAGVIYLLATLPYEDMIASLGIIGALMVMTTAMIIVISKFTRNSELLMMAAVFASVASVVAAVGSIVMAYNYVLQQGGDPDRAIKAILKMMLEMALLLGGILFVSTFFSGGHGSSLKYVAGSIMSIAKTLINLAPAIWVISHLDDEQFKKAMIGLGVIFTGLSILSGVSHGLEAKDTMAVAGLILTFSLAVAALAGTLKFLSWATEDLGFTDAIISLGAIMGLLTIFVGMIFGFQLAMDAMGSGGNIATTLFMVGTLITKFALMVVVLAAAIAVLGAVWGNVGGASMWSAFAALTGLILVITALGVALGIVAGTGAGVTIIVAIIGGLAVFAAVALSFSVSLLIAASATWIFAVAIEKLWSIITDGKNRVVGATQDIAQTGQTLVTGFFDKIKDFFSTKLMLYIAKFVSNFSAFVDSLVTILDELIPAVDKLLSYILDIIQEYVPKYVQKVIETVQPIIEKLKEFFPPLLDVVLSLLKAILDLVIPWLEENLPGWLEKLTPVVESIFKFLINTIANFLVILDSRAEDIVKSVLGIIHKILTLLTQVVDEETGKTLLEEILEKIGVVVGVIVKKLPEILLPILQELHTVFGSITFAIVDAIVKSIGYSLNAVIQSILSALGTIGKDLFFFLEGFINDFLEGAYDWMTGPAIEDFVRFADFLVAAIYMIFMNVMISIGKVIEFCIKFFVDGFLGFGKWLITDGLEYLKTFVEGLKLILLAILQGIEIFASAMIEVLVYGGMLIPKLIVFFLDSIVTSLTDFVNNDCADFLNDLDELGRSIIDLFIQFVNNLATTIEEKGPELNDAFARLVQAIVDVIKDGIQKIFTGDDAPLSTFIKVGTDIITGIINGISDKWDSLFGPNGKLQAMIDRMRSIFSIDTFKTIGENVIKGFEEGLGDAKDGLFSIAVKTFGQKEGVMGEIQEAVGVHSPSWISELFARLVGKGYEEGTEDSEKGMISTVTDTFGNVIGSIFGTAEDAENGGNPISDLINGFVNDWDKDKSFTENIKDIVSNKFGGDSENGGLLGGILGALGLGSDSEGKGLFDGLAESIGGLFTDENGESILDKLSIGTDLDNLALNSDSSKLGDLGGIGETLDDGKLSKGVSSANNRTITSNGTYENTMNDMFNSGQYWNDPNALTNADIVNAIATVVQRLDNIDENMPKEVVLDTGAMVGNLSPEMNRALGRMLRQKGRRT